MDGFITLQVIRKLAEVKREKCMREFSMASDLSAFMSNMASPISLLQDRLTGFPFTHGWLLSQADGTFPADGVLFRLNIDGMTTINEDLSHEDGDRFLREVSHRFQQALPSTATFIRGNGASLLAWIPEVSEAMLQICREHAQNTICATPITLSAGEQVQPRIVLEALPVRQGDSAVDAMGTLEQRDLHQPPAQAMTKAAGRELLAEELQAQLDAMRFIGQAGTVEAIFARLDLPALRPETVVLVGPLQSGKTRLLNALLQLVDAQHSPAIEVLCRPWHQEVAYWLLAAIIRELLTILSRQHPRSALWQSARPLSLARLPFPGIGERHLHPVAGRPARDA